jgi:hypothetical protein
VGVSVVSLRELEPANRYWLFQTLEAGIFIALAAAAIGITFWWVTRKAR